MKGTVLDLGAGCGETVFFFLKHGASRVVAVEPDPTAIKHLVHNFGADPRVNIIPEQVDFIKIDIEGAEKNMIIEPHFQAGLQIIRAHRENGDMQDYLRLIER